MVSGWFGVSWSLAVEEWFYLGFAALLLAGVRLFGARAGFWVPTALFLVLPPVLRWHVPLSADFNEVLSKIVVLRLDAIGFGVVLAWLMARWPERLRRSRLPLLVAGLAILWALTSGATDLLFAGAPRLHRTFVFDLASLGFALCLPAAAAISRLPLLLGGPVRALATRSYVVYLVHLSALEAVGYYRASLGLAPFLALALALASTWALALLSWRFLEAPVLARRLPQHRW
jgi:peptidoglycan/LPS O-acetylase OafA/YrhL